LVDANLLVYAHVRSLPRHDAAKTWLDEQLNGGRLVGLPWPSLLGFVRLVSNPRIFPQPERISAAWAQVGAWLDCPNVWVPTPTDRHREVLGQLLAAATTRANLVPDAHLAALAIEHGLTLASTDADFARFPGLQWQNPLQAGSADMI
ncbi:MAG: type II toxin-antitoxin system VapC family toxin, partial [Verrucomicrobia bacterium]|nr:type II toxin-antitoxin system VapC family toxin [Verrucomicrobiota bacterium]